MKRTLPILSLALLLGGCAAQGERAATREQDALALELAGRTAGEAQRCIPTQQIQNLTIVDRSTVVQRSGRTIWVNRLEGECPGLRPHSTLIAEVHGSQHCRGDLVRGLEPGASIAGPRCPLGDWVPYRAAE